MSRFLKHKNLKLNTRKGFTLVELMVTVTILSLGVVSVYEGFFTSLNAHAYCRNYLSVQSWMNQKIWDIQEALLRYQTLVTQKKSGNFKIGGKEFKWGLHYYSLAAKHGSPGALYHLGICYECGIGVKKNEEVALCYYDQAARNGFKPALEQIYRYCEDSNLFLKDRDNYQRYKRFLEWLNDEDNTK